MVGLSKYLGNWALLSRCRRRRRIMLFCSKPLSCVSLEKHCLFQCDISSSWVHFLLFLREHHQVHQEPSTSPGSSGNSWMGQAENSVQRRRACTELTIKGVQTAAIQRWEWDDTWGWSFVPPCSVPWKDTQREYRNATGWREDDPLPKEVFSLLVPANQGWAICRDKYELKGAAVPRGCELEEGPVIPYHKSPCTESWSKQPHVLKITVF